MPLWLYVVLCVVLPAVWGVMMYYAFTAIDRKRAEQRKADEPPPIDYTI